MPNIISGKTVITIPVYNGEQFIARTLDSCLNQTLTTEVWVVDNCSTDRTVAIVESYQKQHPQVKCFNNEKNLGRTGNWNRCLELFEQSNFEYIKFLFAGDEVLPACVEEYERIFALDPNIGAAASPCEFVDLSGKVIVEKPLANNHLFDIKEVNFWNIGKGGVLGAIVSNVYNKKFINGYRFSEFFIGKADFDYKVLSVSKAYYCNKVLTRFNLDAHRTFFKAQDYILEAEYVFNRAYWLEKNKSMFSAKEYNHLRSALFIEFFSRNFNYYSLLTYLRLLMMIIIKLPKKIVKQIFKLLKAKK